MKIAYIFFGQVKNFNDRQFYSIQENILNQLRCHEIDFFVTTSINDTYFNIRNKETEDTKKDIDYKSINNFFNFKDCFYDNSSFYPEKEVYDLAQNLLSFGESWREGSPLDSTINSLKQLYGLNYFYNHFLKHIEDYDYFILSRSDLYHVSPIDLNFLKENKDIWIPFWNNIPQIDYGNFGGLNDRFAIIKTKKALKSYCTRYNEILKSPQAYHAETYLKQVLDLQYIKYGKINNFLFEMMRAGGVISDLVGTSKDENMNKNLNNISNCFYINLDRREDRRNHFIVNTPFFSQRFSAVDAKSAELNEEIKKLFPKTWNSRKKSEICCALSHYKLWKKLIEDNSSQNYLILEDDVVFEKGFTEFWNEVFSKFIPNSYNLIYLGGCQPWNKPKYHEAVKRYNDYFYNVKKNDFFSKGDHFWHMTTCSYIISKQAANIMCQYIDQFGMDQPLDFFMLRFFDNNKFFSAPDSVFHLNPLMARQLHEENDNTAIDEKSDIRNDGSVFLYTEPENNITKIIHQSWKTKDIPHSIYKKEWIDSWKQKNPDWEYKFWTDEDNRNLVKNHYPQYLELYDSYERPIAKADISRFFYMHKYGGLYVDLDFMCLKSMDAIIEGEKINFGKQKMKDNLLAQNSVPNALIYSPPGDIFWFQCIEELKHHKYNREGSPQGTEHATGPIFLGKCIDKFKPKNLFIHDENTFYPISWELDGSDYNDTIQKEWLDNPESQFPDSFAITYWSGGWRKKIPAKNKMIILVKDLFEEDFIDEIFPTIEYEKIFDPEMKTLEENSLIVLSDMFCKDINIYPDELRPKLISRNNKIKEYFSRPEIKTCTLIHLSDEHCYANIDHYKNFKHVFRQYYRSDAVADNVTFIPLGYKKGFNNE